MVRPDSTLSRVDLPEPDSPTMPRTSPGYSWKDTSWQPLSGPYSKVKSCTDKSGFMMWPPERPSVARNNRCPSKQTCAYPGRQQSTRPDKNRCCRKMHNFDPRWAAQTDNPRNPGCLPGYKAVRQIGRAHV